ncbi:MAG: hypothetical protein CMN75_03665 [Spirochaeta sp.]|nr:hypothetical protein [Spirochaeta sp.]RPG13763.1 MAG: hypothetical protein CBC32_001710 [Proteobacteria bacterium TMED72]
MRWLSVLVILLLSLFLVASYTTGDSLASIQDIPSVSAAGPSLPQKTQRTAVDYEMSLVRTGLLGFGLLVFVVGAVRKTPKASRVRGLILLALALLSFASYYQFFRFSHVRGFATSDNYHYYMGSKYFPELGYFGLYECSLFVLTERGLPPVRGAKAQARNLRNMEIESVDVITQMGSDCPERFTEERWEAFGDEMEFFSTQWPRHLGNATFLDHGYHPTPAWTLVGGQVGNATELVEPLSAYVLSRMDRVLIGAALIAIGLVFGLETAALVALLWGTGILWRYTWVGDAFLRHLWWLTALGGILALKRGLQASGGSMLTLATLFRIFPGALGVGYLAHALRTSLQKRKIPSAHYRFAMGALGTLVTLLILTEWEWGQGLYVYDHFVTKLKTFSSTPISNDIGLGVVSQWIFPASDTASLLLRSTGSVLFIILFWRAIQYVKDWEAAAAGALLIPILTSPANYYFSFFAIAALLSARRPRGGLILLATALLWNLNGLVLYQQHSEFYWASVIAVASCFAVVLELARPVETKQELQEQVEPT